MCKVWSYQIANGLKSIDVENNYNVVFKTISSKAKYIKPLRAIKKATEVVLATDDDREGEAIVAYCKTFNLPIPSTKKLCFK